MKELIRAIESGTRIVRNLAIIAVCVSGSLYLDAMRYPQPYLIAQGCDGAGGDLWAMEESDFPGHCENVETWRK